MVAHLLKLQLALQKAGFRRNAWALVGLIFGLLYALGASFFLILGAVFGRGHTPGLIGGFATIIGAVLVLGWCLLPLLVFGTDETLDPGRFALLPLRARDLMPGLLLAGFLSPSGVLLVLVCVAFLILWSTGVITLIAAVLGAALGVLTCFLSSRVLTSALSAGLSGRRSRDVTAVLFGVLAIFFGLGMQVASRGLQSVQPDRMGQLLRDLAAVAAWTPFGWAWALPWDFAEGHLLVGALRLVLSLALVVGLWFAWRHFLDRALTQPLEAAGPGGKVEGGRVDRMFPATPAGAVASRSLKYWRRDSRHVISLVSIVAMPFLILVPIFINGRYGGVPAVALIFAPAMIGIMAGIGVSNEISYDGSAFWTHLSCGLSGRDDRRGRVWALAVILVPVVLVVMFGALIATGRWDLFASAFALSAVVLLSALGIGAWVGAYFIVPTPPPGQRNAFGKGNGGGFAGILNLFLCWIGTFVVTLPTLILVSVGFSHRWLGWVALPVGLLCGVGALWLGIRNGGRALDRRYPEVLKAATYEKH